MRRDRYCHGCPMCISGDQDIKTDSRKPFSWLKRRVRPAGAWEGTTCSMRTRAEEEGGQEGITPVAEQRSGAAGAEDGGGQQEGAVAAAVVVVRRVLVIHDQARHVGRRLHARHRSAPAALLVADLPRHVNVGLRMSC